MRKKLLSTLLALSVALTLVPLSALAEGNDGSSDAAGGQQGKVEELTPNLTEVKTETRTDDTSGKSASVIEVSVAPNAKVPFSPKEEAIGRTRDGWWVGVKIVAPKGVILDTSDGTGSSGAVLFRNNGDNEDRAWKDPIVDGGNGSETDPYYMGAWIGPSLEKLAAGETIYNAVWYFNWDGSNDTGITIEKEEFTGATGAADMKGVDQIIKVTFELKDGVQLAGKEESDGLAWPINVTFNTNEGSPVAAQKLGLGCKAEEPSVPTRNGYTFGGWYTEKECKTAWDFNKDTVTRDLTLYAKWTENTQTPTAPTLSFAIPDNSEDLFGKKASDLLTGGSVSSGAAGSDGKIPVAVSGTAKEITDYTQFNEADKTEQNGHYLPLKITPRGSGCKVTVTGSKTKTFENWPEAGDTLVMRLDALTGYRFEVKVEKEGKSTTYTVDCSKVMPKPDEKYTVTYDSQGGSSVEKQTVSAGGKAEEPSAPTRNGYTFGGWYTEKECKTAWDFNKDTVTRDLTLYAKWTEKTNTGDEPNEDGEYEINIRSGIRHGTVEVSRWYAEPGTRVTITVDPESDYVVDWVEAVRESNGRVLSLTQSGRRYTFTMPASDVTIDAGFRLQHVYTYTYFEPVAPARPAVFTPVFTPASWRSPVALKDVPTTSWNYASAQWAYQNGYLDVAADGTFRLDGPVSHQQMWRIMASWLGESSMSAQELANWAKQNGAANGSPAASSMTRQDVVVYLYQCCFLMGGDVSSSGNLGSYADSRLITASSVRSAWTWAVDKGIISGTADGYLHPGSTVSRGEFAAMLMRLCQSA